MLLRTLAICSLFHLGCLAIDTPVPLVVADAGGDMGCPTNPQQDLAPAPAKCAAAQGLSGDVLLCVDFDKVAGLDAPELKGWDFSNSNDCPSWLIDAGILQIKDYVKLKSSCRFKMPYIDTSDTDKSKYKSITLAVLQTINVSSSSSNNSIVQIFLGVESEDRQITQQTGKQRRQLNIFSIRKSDLPSGLTAYQYLFKITNLDVGSVGQNWSIESIAVVGNIE